MFRRDEAIYELDAAATRIDASIGGLTDEQASRPSSDGWSVKDQLTHITFWHEMRFFEVSRIAHGGHASFPLTEEAGVEHLNEQIAANRRSLALEQVVADLQFAREMVRQALLAAPEDLAMTHFAEIGPVGSSHEMAHADMIAAWRRREGT